VTPFTCALRGIAAGQRDVSRGAILKHRAVALINPQVQELIIAATCARLDRTSRNINAEIDA